MYCNATCWERHARELAFGEAVFVDSPHGFRVELKPDGERVTVRVLGEVDLATTWKVHSGSCSTAGLKLWYLTCAR